MPRNMTAPKKRRDFSRSNNLDVAQYIRSTMAEKNMSRAEIAKHIGYSLAFVDQHLRLLTLPKIFMPLIIGVSDYSAVYRLGTLYDKQPKMVERWIKNNPHPSNAEIRHFIRKAAKEEHEDAHLRDDSASAYQITGKHFDHEGVILLDRGATSGKVWMQFTKSRQIREVNANAIRKLRLIHKDQTASMAETK